MVFEGHPGALKGRFSVLFRVLKPVKQQATAVRFGLTQVFLGSLRALQVWEAKGEQPVLGAWQ